MSNHYLDLQRQQINANLAKNLVLARNATDLTQSNLAQIANISRATIAQIESGEGDPRLSTIIDIATSLGISPVLLLIGEDELNALINLVKEYEEENISDEDKEKMEFLLSTGIKKNKIKAAKIGIAATAGLSSVGAAIGSVLLPGIGTIVGASFGALVSKNFKGKDDEKEK
ncbi:MAG: helix-turn-helix domain-containing protein [Flavobacteriaceae bacterium]|nr:helix-turn-helix domain-containing protein [Flavobacteriaceae bacterium]